MTRFVILLFVLIVVVRLVTARLSRRDGGSKRLLQREAVAERFRLAAAEQAKRAAHPSSQGFPVIPPSPQSPPPVSAMTPIASTPPTLPTPQATPPSVTPPSGPDTSLASSLDTSLSTTLGAPMAETEHAVPAGPQIVPLSPDLERRVVELMEQNFEVMAVRLLCDELHIGILDAQKTVRTLVGLPTNY